ncbi:MAG: heat-inducible transcription repressor HrcA, partial [Nitrospinaceae bacterium]|nr:heat-inducible transcription repressor HrcA [Nitrospinaceae bacterium]NIS86460.1 heat-inducible transcription repressor HrcA [Nitrospinaceae bacterium]NIT83295.1 heat-inducible transcription repressor HrcA [Nitrospinaceae bacterium]NIU45505.1 heat-inducible transcription repressor HrcA [Nitrospinaceae bacterium]NIU97658.1 heat-inducible transcription repressor HrcA [Nitrospinaceae bacterium]
MKKAMDLSARVFAPEENEAGNLLVDGVLNFFDKPEFADDLNKIKSLIQTLQEKTKLVKLLDLCLKHDDMTVLIGQENADEEMHGCSLIAQNYQLGKEKLGTLAIFGPKRMDYKKVIWIVNDTAKTVSQLISKKFAHLN